MVADIVNAVAIRRPIPNNVPPDVIEVGPAPGAARFQLRSLARHLQLGLGSR